MTRKGIIYLTFLSILFLLVGVMFFTIKKQNKVYEFETYVFGTEVKLKVVTNNEKNANDIANKIFHLFFQMHNELHAWKESEVTRLNDNIAKNIPFKASIRLSKMLKHAQIISSKSDGLFNPGISLLIRAWGFQKDRFDNNLVPKEKELSFLLKQNPSILSLIIDSNNIVTSKNKYVAIDFGGYAKGWALDEAEEILRKNNINNALLSIGGDIRALGSKLGKQWKVGIKDPRKEGIIAYIVLNDGETIATSGDYYRYFKQKGVKYSHIINPKTGYPAREVQTISIITDKKPNSGALADAASKPFYILGKDKALDLMEKLDINKVLLIDKNSEVWISLPLKNQIYFKDKNLKINYF